MDNTLHEKHEKLTDKLVFCQGFLREAEQIMMQHRDLQYMFVILPPNTNNDIYSMVKEMEITHGVITQCVRLGMY